VKYKDGIFIVILNLYFSYYIMKMIAIEYPI